MTKDELDELWAAFHRALEFGLTDVQVDAAMTAAKEESLRWLGHLGFEQPIGAIVGAALRAVAATERV